MTVRSFDPDLLRLGPKGARIDGDGVTPDLSGSLTFSAGQPGSHPGWHRAHVVRTRETLTSGSLTVGYDSGPAVLAAPELHAYLLQHEAR
jgi:hypothetical protein